jgi:hypothetical protein
MQFPLSTVQVQGILNTGIDKMKKANSNDDDGELLVAGTDHRRKVHNYPVGY